MSEELEKLWGKLSLTEAEQTKVLMDGYWLEEAKKVWKNCLIGKLIINKKVDVKVMKIIISIVWKLSSRMSITEVGSRLFIFQFEDNEEKERVLL